MTALRLAGRRLSAGLTLEMLSFALVALVAIGASFLAYRAPAADAEPQAQAEVRVPLSQARALIAATSGEAADDVSAVGDKAKLINASLPFSSTPVQAAHPFALSGSGTDHSRALLCLTQAVYYEAGFEPMAGRRAVAQVVLNRMRHPAFPKSVCGVVYQGARLPVCQFSFVCDGSLYRAPSPAAWNQARDIAKAALAGHVEQTVGSATHYHADYVAPRWAPMLAKISKIGAHIFYRWPGAWGTRAAFTGRYAGEPQDPLGLRPPLQEDEIEAAVEQAVVAGPVTDGTVLKRAPNDVGGLLDVSKGWTLTIPSPDEVGSAAARAMAAQKAPATAPATTSLAATGAPVVAPR